MTRRSISSEGDETIVITVKIPRSWKNKLNEHGNMSFEVRTAIAKHLNLEGYSSATARQNYPRHKKPSTHTQKKTVKSDRVKIPEIWNNFDLDCYNTQTAHKIQDILHYLGFDSSDPQISPYNINHAIQAVAGSDKRTIEKYAKKLFEVEAIQIPEGGSINAALNRICISQFARPSDSFHS
ncbi:MAG: hypothetical protein SVK08_01280 [Halobacteriota archaeon]|nr:hypothetical protein [Halobacteriota archaeon]